MGSSVIFVCTGNSCRSQMAEGLLRFLGSEDFNAFSAGTDPHGLNPLAVQVMKEIDIDISGHESESIDLYGNGTSISRSRSATTPEGLAPFSPVAVNDCIGASTILP